MFRVLGKNTIRRALQQSQKFSTTKAPNASLKRPSVYQVTLSTVSKRSFSARAAGQPKELALALAGIGILTTTSSILYYISTSSSSSSTPKDVLQEVVEEPVTSQEEVQETVSEKTEVVVKASTETDEVEEKVSPSAVESVDDQEIKAVSYPEFPTSSPYVIIGAGTAAHAACRAIRKKEPNAKILLIGNEEMLPYMRPPLSKELWFSDNPDVADTLVFKSWNGKERSVFFEDDVYYTSPKDFSKAEEGAVTVLTGKKVINVDAETHNIKLESGEEIEFGKLLIATGGKPRNHPVFVAAGPDVQKHVTLFRKVSDFQSLEKIVKNSERIAVVGGGFLGSELACALAAAGKNSNLTVTQIYAEEGNMAKVLPRYLSEWTTRKVKKEGIDVISDRSVKNVSSTDMAVQMELDNGDKVSADHVIVCVGIEPNVELAKSAGLEVDPEQGGFRVNSELEARSDIWVAGDAACFYDINLGRRRVEHHDHAVVSGRLAGENMTGAKKVYKHQSMFWSDLGPDVGYEAIGLVDSTLPTVGIWAKATADDTPKAAEQASGKSIPSERDSVSTETAAPVDTDISKQSEKANTTDSEEAFGKGVVFYMNGKKIVGILLWNIFSQMPVARRIITEGKEHDDLNTVAKLFNVHK